MRTARAAGQTFELVEMYDEATAKAMQPNDTSFVALGEIEGDEVDSYDAKSMADQFVTIALVPEKQLDDFDLTVKSSDGRVLATSRSHCVGDQVNSDRTVNLRWRCATSMIFSRHRPRY